jgi:hypothetical protein
MLDVTYEATGKLAPGRLAEIEEDRGTIRVRLDEREPLAVVVRQLNIEIDDLMSSSHWFQLWGDEIISRDTPGAPLHVQYLLVPNVPNGVGVKEDKGTVRVYIGGNMTVKEFAAAMNPTTKDFLAGGQWFQLYGGEIVDNGPEPMSRV